MSQNIPLYGQNAKGGVLGEVADGKTYGHETLPLTTDRSLDASDSGKTIFVDATGAAAEVDINLPAVAAGLNFRFIVSENTPTQDVKIVASGAIVYGTLSEYFIEAAGTLTNRIAAAGVTNVLFDQTCLKGDWIEYYCDGTSWYINGACSVAGGFTTS